MPKTKPPISKRRKRSSRSALQRGILNKKKLNKLASKTINSISDSEVIIEPSESAYEVVEDVMPIENEIAYEVVEDLMPIEREIDQTYKPLKSILCGRRLANLGHLLSEYEKVVQHQFHCTMGRMQCNKEIRKGLITYLYFYCDNCEKTCVVTSEPTDDVQNDVNKAAVWGALSVGIGRNQCEELFSVLQVPFMSPQKFVKETNNLKQNWEDYLYAELQRNGIEERNIAMGKGHVKPDGTPYITVIVDGGWSKRSYGHGYNAASGVGIIIGMETRKPLFLGVRNKVCSICAYYKNKGIDPKKHVCSLNFTGPSTAMESDIVVDGFCNSLTQHGLMYKFVIGDGDSNVYASIVDKVPYGRQVTKIECANHMTRCVSNKLYRLIANTSYSLEMRKLLTERINGISRLERIIKGVRTTIKEHVNDPVELRKDILNVPRHIFGNHDNCGQFCNRKGKEQDMFSSLEPNFLMQIKKILDPILSNAHVLAYNRTTNQAERYMSLVAKFVGGKRVNFSKRMSYTTRAYGAAISHTSGPGWHDKAWNAIYKTSGTVLKHFCIRRMRRLQNQRKHRLSKPAKPKTKCGGPDQNYGPEAACPDLPEEELEVKKTEFLQKLSDRIATHNDLLEIEEKTRGQHTNQNWHDLRKDYLTASNFGTIIKRRHTTPCHNLVKRLLYCHKQLSTPAIIYGREHEGVAIQKYEQLQQCQVTRCGLFVDRNNPYLAASPDGVVGSDGLVEVKCLYSFKGKLKDASKSSYCFEVVGNKIRLKKQHNYFYQVQGQLHITNRTYCDFIIYTENDFHIERIFPDKSLWNEVMLPKLRSFYIRCIVPEIVDGRVPRGMTIRDSNHREVTENKENRKPKKRKTCSQ